LLPAERCLSREASGRLTALAANGPGSALIEQTDEDATATPGSDAAPYCGRSLMDSLELVNDAPY